MLFDVASVGKTFIAALIFQLAGRGAYLSTPWEGGCRPSRTSTRLSPLRQLLGHTSGVFDFVEHPRSPSRVPFTAIGFAEVSSPARVVFDLAGDPYFRRGEGWHYSSTNYVLLRMIAVKATGSTAAEELRRRFIEPLQLRHTVVFRQRATMGPVLMTSGSGTVGKSDLVVDVVGPQVGHGDADSWQFHQELDALHAAELRGTARGKTTELVELAGKQDRRFVLELLAPQTGLEKHVVVVPDLEYMRHRPYPRGPF